MGTVKFQMFKLILEKAEEPRDQIANIHWIIKKARVSERHLLLLYCPVGWALGSALVPWAVDTRFHQLVWCGEQEGSDSMLSTLS